MEASTSIFKVLRKFRIEFEFLLYYFAILFIIISRVVF